MTLISCTCKNMACQAAPHMGRQRCTSSVTVDFASVDATTWDSSAIYGPLLGWVKDDDDRNGRCRVCVITNS
jgi:hypothetical protein